jgi:hypothetical protein
MMRRQNLAMSLGGLAAILLDYVVVASVVGLLFFRHSIGVALTLDVLTFLLVSYAILAWFYGKRFSEFLSREEEGRHR